MCAVCVHVAHRGYVHGQDRQLVSIQREEELYEVRDKLSEQWIRNILFCNLVSHNCQTEDKILALATLL